MNIKQDNITITTDFESRLKRNESANTDNK